MKPGQCECTSAKGPDGRVGATARFLAKVLIGAGWIAGLARGEETVVPKPGTSSPPRERAVSPHVADMVAAGLPKFEASKARKESPETVTANAVAEGKAGDPIVVMDPFHVTDTSSKRRLMDAVEKQQNQKKMPAFTLKEGGTILTSPSADLMLKYKAEHKGFDILKLKF